MTVARFWAKVTKDCPIPYNCWLWTACRDRRGYGRIDSRYAHRLSYEMHVGPIPNGMVIDHLCRVRHCVNPAHLEAVSQQLNVQRQGRHSRNASGYRGVSWDARRQKWAAYATVDGVKRHAGRFSDLNEAGQAAAALRYRLMKDERSK